MMRSPVKVTNVTMFFVLILMAGFCSATKLAKDNKPPDTKVTALFYTHAGHYDFFDSSWMMLVYGEDLAGITYQMLYNFAK